MTYIPLALTDFAKAAKKLLTSSIEFRLVRKDQKPEQSPTKKPEFFVLNIQGAQTANKADYIEASFLLPPDLIAIMEHHKDRLAPNLRTDPKAFIAGAISAQINLLELMESGVEINVHDPEHDESYKLEELLWALYSSNAKNTAPEDVMSATISRLDDFRPK